MKIRRKSAFWITIFCMVLLTGCRQETASAREVMEQVCENLNDMSGCKLTAQTEMAVSVYGQPVQYLARSEARISFAADTAQESVHVSRDGQEVTAMRYDWQGADGVKPFRAAADMERFLNNTAFFFVEGEEDAGTAYTIEGLVDTGSLGGMEDLKKMTAFLPADTAGGWSQWAKDLSFPVRIKVDRETGMPVELAFNVSEAVQAPVRESICVLGIPEEQVQAGSCVITYRYEDFQRTETDGQSGGTDRKAWESYEQD